MYRSVIAAAVLLAAVFGLTMVTAFAHRGTEPVAAFDSAVLAEG